MFHGVDFDVSIDAVVALAKKNKMVFNSEDLVLITVLCQGKRL